MIDYQLFSFLVSVLRYSVYFIEIFRFLFIVIFVLLQGVVHGVGGVFTKPFSGAKEEGVEGFFKGFGKGMVGLVTRPTAGVVDFASGTFSSVKRYSYLLYFLFIYVVSQFILVQV